MPRRAQALIIAIGMALSSTAYAALPPVSMAAGPGGPSAHLERPGLKPGMVVVDRKGRRVGVLQRVNATADGKPAVILEHNGASLRLRTSHFRLSRRGDKAVILLSPSRIRTAAILNTP